MDVVKWRYWFFLLSALVILPGIVSLLIPPRLNLGIDFTGGSTISVGFQKKVPQEDLRTLLALLGHPQATVQSSGGNSYFIRTATLKESKGGGPSEKQSIQDAMEKSLSPIATFEFDSMSPLVARETVRTATIAVVVASILILLYISWAFRRVGRPFRYGVVAVIALIHDVLVVLGSFSILGRLMGAEVNAMFITGILTVIGYSVHDTIVVLDRIRENLARGTAQDLEGVVNASVLETISRSLNTSLTTLFAIMAMFLLGGSTLRDFLLVLLIGFITGVYSSICIASQLLVVWEKNDIGRFLKRIFARRAPAPTA